MKITFCGAAGEVTGSCHLLEAGGKKILIDCGMFQGSQYADERNHEKFPFDASQLDAVLVTHAHIDHTGRLPRLVTDGYTGPIYATAPTLGLMPAMLEDTYHIMMENEKRLGHPLVYSESDFKHVEALGQVAEYGRPIKIGNVTVTFHDAGHILGSSFIEIVADGKRIVFSGDLGNSKAPLICDTENLMPNLDALIMESTYGNRMHDAEGEREEIIAAAIKESVARGGALVIPSFAIERTQALLFLINNLIEKKEIPKVTIYLDSPLAIKATRIYKESSRFYDEEAKNVFLKDNDLFDFPGLVKSENTQQSKSINNAPNPKVVIAGSGMMNGGRVLHHLVRYLPDPKSTIMIVGYQAHGTLGRQLFEGAKSVHIYRETVEVKATIKSIGAFSAHADQGKMMEWVKRAMPKKVILIHGEDDSRKVLTQKLADDLHIPAFMPKKGETIEI